MKFAWDEQCSCNAINNTCFISWRWFISILDVLGSWKICCMFWMSERSTGAPTRWTIIVCGTTLLFRSGPLIVSVTSWNSLLVIFDELERKEIFLHFCIAQEKGCQRKEFLIDCRRQFCSCRTDDFCYRTSLTKHCIVHWNKSKICSKEEKLLEKVRYRLRSRWISRSFLSLIWIWYL